MATIHLNGRFLPADEACISPLDRGFIFGDGIYEVIPVYNGHAFRLMEHLTRLNNNLNSVKIIQPHTRDEWQTIIEQLIVANGNGDQSVYLQITRGIAKRDHAFPDGIEPTVFLMSNPLMPLDTEILTEGVKVITTEDIRWKNCHIKSIALQANVLLRQAALEQGATEAILIRDGQVTEGAASNVFIIKDGSLITPPKSPFLLPGITRDLILELASKNNIPALEAAITHEQLNDADEIWLTSSTKEIVPVTMLNDQPVGLGKPGAIWQQMSTIYQTFKQNYCN